MKDETRYSVSVNRNPLDRSCRTDNVHPLMAWGRFSYRTCGRGREEGRGRGDPEGEKVCPLRLRSVRTTVDRTEASDVA